MTYLVVVVQRWASPYLKASNVGYILPCSASHLEVNFRSCGGRKKRGLVWASREQQQQSAYLAGARLEAPEGLTRG